MKSLAQNHTKILRGRILRDYYNYRGRNVTFLVQRVRGLGVLPAQRLSLPLPAIFPLLYVPQELRQL